MGFPWPAGTMVTMAAGGPWNMLPTLFGLRVHPTRRRDRTESAYGVQAGQHCWQQHEAMPQTNQYLFHSRAVRLSTSQGLFVKRPSVRKQQGNAPGCVQRLPGPGSAWRRPIREEPSSWLRKAKFCWFSRDALCGLFGDTKCFSLIKAPG